VSVLDASAREIGAVVLVLAGIVLLLFTTSLGAVGLGLLLVVLLLLVAWAVIGRLKDWLRDGKPLVRGDWRGEGGE
jgi:hypothetical protein